MLSLGHVRTANTGERRVTSPALLTLAEVAARLSAWEATAP